MKSDHFILSSVYNPFINLVVFKVSKEPEGAPNR